MNQSRLIETLSAFAACNDTPGNGVTRFSWSGADKKARQLLARICLELGLTVSTDGIGNVRAVLPGEGEPVGVILGSHMDSVRNGGQFDGIYGVCAALEVIRSICESGARPKKGIELVAFAEEEGSNFGCTCLGSKAVTGHLDLAELKILAGGKAWECLKNFGLEPENLPRQQFTDQNGAVFLEVHIEQNRYLEENQKSLGIVTAICGMRLYAVTFTGVADHAASPMEGRRDPMAAFARFASHMEDMCRAGKLGRHYSVTIGKVECWPNVGIVSPEKVAFTIDFRHVDVPVLEAGARRVLEMCRQIADMYHVGMEATLLSASGGSRMDPALDDLLRQAANERGVAWMDMISGPAHDAACMARVMPTALLFVPSAKGLSHCPQEYTEPGYLALGAQILEDVTRRLAM